MTTFDFVSDLHLDFNELLYLQYRDTHADCLIVAGDLIPWIYLDPRRTDPTARSMRKNFTKLVNQTWSHYKKIYWLPGNHEYYGGWLNLGDKRAKQLAPTIDPRLEFVNNDVIEYGNTVLIFSILWTSFNNRNPLAMLEVSNALNDYIRIYSTEHDYIHKKVRISTDEIADVHDDCQSFLNYAFKKYNKKRKVVITHHAPSFRSRVGRSHSSSVSDFGFYNSMDDWIMANAPALWIHAHTHLNVDYKIGDTHVLTAQYGYNRYERIAADPLLIGRFEI